MDTSPGKASSWQYQQQHINAEIKPPEESLRMFKLREHSNTFSPISSLPVEIIAAIFLLVRSPSTGGRPDIRTAHVCRRWRKIALGLPTFWSYVNFTVVSPAGATVMLARAKMAPLYLEANISSYGTYRWDDARIDAFQKEFLHHVSHVYHLRIMAKFSHLIRILERLTSPAPILKQLSLSSTQGYETPPLEIYVPDTLFDATTPKLSSLELSNCNINWKSPLLKHLETIRFHWTAKPSLTDWLDALDELPQLKRVVLHLAPLYTPYFLCPFHAMRTVTLPSLAHFDITAPWLDCGLALAHLILPALTCLRVTTNSLHPTARDLQTILPYIVQHAHGPQDTEPLQSMSILRERRRLDILTWPTFNSLNSRGYETLTERVALSITCTNEELNVLDDLVSILDAAVVALPLDGLVTFTSRNATRLGPEAAFWRRHGPRWPLLKHLRLGRLPARGFREAVLQDNGGRECPLFPSLTRLDLLACALSARRTLLLCDTLMKRVEQGVPLEVLDLRTCSATSAAVQLLSEIVVDVWGPEKFKTTWTEESTFDGARGTFVSDYDSGEEYYYDDYLRA